MFSTEVSHLSSASSSNSVEFGPYRYDPLRRQVYAAEGPLRIGSRAIELLGVLLESPGRLYSREELVSRVWQRSIVEETSLRVHMSALRRQLGESPRRPQYIKNVPGRGYAFIAPVQPSRVNRTLEVSRPLSTRPMTSAALNLQPLVGRAADIAALGKLLVHARLVSLIGVAGVGKTTVVNMIRASHDHNFKDGATVVDLAAVSETSDVTMEFCRALALPWTGPRSLEDSLREREMLIVLDHAEHVVEAVAALVDRLTHACARLTFLFAGCEPLLLAHEHIYKLAPLALPLQHAPCSAENLLSFPAVRLLFERARARGAAFEITEHNAAAVRRLCMLLDGIPLALELAAARVLDFGVFALASSCESSMALLGHGRRTAVPRHRSIQALLAWSCNSLTERQRDTLQRLSKFHGDFSLRDASAWLSGPDQHDQSLMDDLLALCSKSILHTADSWHTEPKYRLSHAMRLFAQAGSDGSQRQATRSDPPQGSGLDVSDAQSRPSVLP